LNCCSKSATGMVVTMDQDAMVGIGFT